MTKRLISLALTLLLAVSFAACKEAAPESTGPKDYTAILSDARSAEQNDAAVIFHYQDGTWSGTGAYAGELSAEDLESQASLSLQVLNLDPEDVAEASYSVSMMMVQSYGVAIVKPAEGKTEAVKAGLQDFIEAQKAAQQNYLADQYEIAKNAKLEVLKSGEVVLVMCDGQNDVFDSIKAALK